MANKPDLSSNEPVKPYKKYAYYPHNKILFVLEQNSTHDNFGTLDAGTFFDSVRFDLQSAVFEDDQFDPLMKLLTDALTVAASQAYDAAKKSAEAAKQQKRNPQKSFDIQSDQSLTPAPDDAFKPIQIRSRNKTLVSIFQLPIDNVDPLRSDPKVAPLGTVINFIYKAINTWQPSIGSGKKSSQSGSLSAQSAGKPEETSSDKPPKKKPPVWNPGHSRKENKKNFGNIILVSPDWLGGSSQVSGSQTPTGGPESKPGPVTTSPPPVPQYSLPAAFKNLIGRPAVTPLDPPVTQVDVYVLDTLPKFENIELRHNRLEQDRGANNPLRRFFGTGKLASIAKKLDGAAILSGAKPNEFKANNREFHYVASLPNCDMNSFSGVRLLDTDYLMPDHGLFIAGIISSIVDHPPSASLSHVPVKYHLIEVLDNYGIGTISTMLAGLAKVQQLLDAKNPSIINCSFTLSLPIDNHIDDELDALMTYLLDEIGFRQWLIDVISDLFASATIPANGEIVGPEPDCVIVAASGNDSNDPRPDGTLPADRLKARYPAAIDGVVGVGACDASGQLTDYTNYADIPNTIDLYAFGGAVGGAPDRQIMGLFTSSPFPTPATGSGGALGTAAANTTGLAYWTGTSFAAPIISGALALYCAYNRTSVQVALQAVRNSAGADHIFM